MLAAVVVALWGTISLYFLWRYLRFRKWVSIALMAMSMGWLAVGLDDFGIVDSQSPTHHVVAVLVGLLFWAMVLIVERSDR